MMLEKIKNCLKNRQFVNNRQLDAVFEEAWLALHHLLYQTPENCKRFLDRDGLRFFITYLKVEIIIIL